MKSPTIRKSKKRTAVYSILYLIAIIIGTTVIHEIGHFLAALVLGVPVNEITINFMGINPGFKIPDILYSSSLSIYHWAGGLFAAVILLIVYFVFLYRKYRIKPSLLLWIMGWITLGTCGEEIGNAVVEGNFHTLYIYTVNSPFSRVNIMIALFAIFGLCLHFIIFPLSKLKKKSS
jgi:hypothetical protein